MTVISRQNLVTQLQRDISRINLRLSDLARDESDANVRIAQNERSLARTANAATVQSHQREIRRLNDVLLLIRSDRARFTRMLARKTDELHKAQNVLADAQRQELARQAEAIAHAQRGAEAAQVRNPSSAPQDPTSVRYDAFISHASEDKADVALPLCDALKALGYRVWLDVFELRIGDSLRRSIDRGLVASRFGIVVLSPHFMVSSRKWTNYELDGLLAREDDSGKVILPLWHNVSKSDVLKFSPALTDKIAANTGSFTMCELAKKFADVFGEPCGGGPGK